MQSCLLMGTGNKQTGSDPKLPRSSKKSRKKSRRGAESSASEMHRQTEDGVAISVGGDPPNPGNVPAANGYRQSGWTYIFYLLLYVLLGSCIYYFLQLCSEGTEFRGGGISFIDGIYVSTQTVTTVGYGDVLPATTFSKAFILCYVSAGLFLLAIVYEVVSEVMDRFEIWIMEVCGMKKNRIDNPTVHETQLLIRIVISLIYLVSSIVGCVFALRHWENMKGFKAVYVSVVTVTTLGFGDLSFTSTRGRLFFSFWILVSYLLVFRIVSLVTALTQSRRRVPACWINPAKRRVKALTRWIRSLGWIVGALSQSHLVW